MALTRTTARSNDVRAPEVPRGTAVIVARYREDNPKVALINPEDLSMLEDAYDLVEHATRREPLPQTPLAEKAMHVEDRPDPAALVEDPARLAAIFGS